MHPWQALAAGFQGRLGPGLGIFPSSEKIFQKNNSIFEKNICICEKIEYNKMEEKRSHRRKPP